MTRTVSAWSEVAPSNDQVCRTRIHEQVWGRSRRGLAQIGDEEQNEICERGYVEKAEGLCSSRVAERDHVVMRVVADALEETTPLDLRHVFTLNTCRDTHKGRGDSFS
eukprot:766941-Hanusia_phi.AAC.4